MKTQIQCFFSFCWGCARDWVGLVSNCIAGLFGGGGTAASWQPIRLLLCENLFPKQSHNAIRYITDSVARTTSIRPIWPHDHMITRALLTLLLTRTDYPISWVSLKTGTCEWANAVATQSIWVAVMSPILTFVNIWEYTMIYRGKLYEHNIKCIQKLGKHSSGLFAGAALHDRLDISLQKGKNGVLYGGEI